MGSRYRISECTYDELSEYLTGEYTSWNFLPSMMVLKCTDDSGERERCLWIAYMSPIGTGATEVGLLRLTDLKPHWRTLIEARNFMNHTAKKQKWTRLFSFVPAVPETYRRFAEFFGMEQEAVARGHYGDTDGLLMGRDLRRRT